MQLPKKISVGVALLLVAGSSAFAATAPSKAAGKSTPAKSSPAATKSAATRSAASKSVAGKSAAGKRTRRYRRRDRGQKAPTADRITEIQQALAKYGSFTGKVSGKWDASTITATRRFQEAHGLNPTGKLDALTLQKLGLGSETAGIAAPLPPANSSLNSNPASNSSTAASTAQPAHPEQ